VPSSNVTTPTPDGDGMIDTSGGGGVTSSSSSSSSNTTTTSSPFAAYASAEWCEWFGKLSADGRAQVEAAILAVDVAGAEEEQDEAADRSDAAAFLLLHFGVCVVVLADYFLAQEWPGGGGFLCRWAYFTSIVMYKPFTVPMWSCLLPLCSYTFAELLFGGCKGGRDEATGTPRGAPFERNKLTMGVAYATIVLQGAWFVAAITLGLPLAVVFVHVVVLVFFGVPFGATFLMQKLLGPVEMWWRARFKKGALELVKQDGMKLGGCRGSGGRIGRWCWRRWGRMGWRWSMPPRI
jgi:hypothetical protein